MTAKPLDRGVWIVSAALVLALLLFAGRYGYHRDELYFLIIGSRPDVSYVDQPALVPLLDHLVHALTGSLWALRATAALAAGAGVLVVGAIARELGASAQAQRFAAAGWAISAVVLATGHLATTTVWDLLTWALLSWWCLRALRTGLSRDWLVVGLIAGVGLNVKALLALLLGTLVLAVLLVGPRSALQRRGPWLGAAIAVALWLPWWWWQSQHSWPQWGMSERIAAGSSASSESRWLFLPYQLVLLSPVLVPVWWLGWRALWSRRLGAGGRAYALAVLLGAVVLLVAGGKPYYLSGYFPVLLAAGAEPALAWASVRRWRWLLAVGAAVNLLLFVPVLPVSWLAKSPVTAVNSDASETVAWPEFAAWVSRRSEPGVPVIAANYGEAGALARFEPGIEVHSGHNALADAGPPPGEPQRVVLVGFDEDEAAELFGRVRTLAEWNSPYGLDNEEDGALLILAESPRAPWSQLWRRLTRLG